MSETTPTPTPRSDDTLDPQTSMLAAHYTAFGEPKDVLKLQRIPLPVFPADCVIVQVFAAALNPVDYKLMEGYMSIFANPPRTACMDFSGKISQVGANVRQLSVGDLVYGKAPITSAGGSLAEYVVVPLESVALKPAGMSHEEAAGLALAGLTSYQALFEHARLKPGQKVLVLGGSGGTGHIGVQLAKSAGAYVTATCSERNVDFVKSMGADRVIDYTKEDWSNVLAGQNYDVLYDTVGGPTVYDDSKKVLKACGRFVTIAGDGDQRLSFGNVVKMSGVIMGRKIAGLFGQPHYTLVMLRECGDHLDALAQLVSAGKLKVVVDSQFDFTDEGILGAFERQKSSRAVGKIVVTVRK